MSSVDDYVVYCEVSIMYEKHFRHFGAVEVSNVFAYAILDRCADDITISDDMIHYSYADDRNRQYALFIFENDNEFVNIVQKVEVEFFNYFFIAIQDVKTIDDLNITKINQANSYINSLSIYLSDECGIKQLLPRHRVMLKQAIDVMKTYLDKLSYAQMQLDDAMNIYDYMIDMKVIRKKTT